MVKALSLDFRRRVVNAIECGLSCRKAAERCGVSASSFLLGAVAKTPDVTLVELQEKLKARGVSAGVGTLWRFFDRRRFTFKKRRRMLPNSNATT
jgi:transposase